jgi:hypothetical protein
MNQKVSSMSLENDILKSESFSEKILLKIYAGRIPRWQLEGGSRKHAS